MARRREHSPRSAPAAGLESYEAAVAAIRAIHDGPLPPLDYPTLGAPGIASGDWLAAHCPISHALVSYFATDPTAIAARAWRITRKGWGLDRDAVRYNAALEPPTSYLAARAVARLGIVPPPPNGAHYPVAGYTYEDAVLAREVAIAEVRLTSDEREAAWLARRRAAARVRADRARVPRPDESPAPF